MGLFDGLLELMAPTRCAGCELPGELLCGECDSALPRIERKTACARCGAPYGGLVCTECWNTRYAFEGTVAVGELDGALARAIVLHKDAGERRLGALLGGLVGEACRRDWPGWPHAVTWIPPSRVALARRGFDHGQALAEPAAVALGVPALRLLQRPRSPDQRMLGRAERFARAGDRFSVVAQIPARVLVVDDVMTTGATVDAAAAALLAHGAQSVRAAVVARKW